MQGRIATSRTGEPSAMLPGCQPPPPAYFSSGTLEGGEVLNGVGDLDAPPPYDTVLVIGNHDTVASPPPAYSQLQ